MALARETDGPFVIFFGHGKNDQLLGHKASAVIGISSGVAPAELKGRKLYTAACFAGDQLGPTLAAAGCEFIGYNKRIFVPLDSHASDAISEIVSEAFLEWVRTDDQGKASELLTTKLKTLSRRKSRGASLSVPTLATFALALSNAVCSYPAASERS